MPLSSLSLHRRAVSPTASLSTRRCATLTLPKRPRLLSRMTDPTGPEPPQQCLRGLYLPLCRPTPVKRIGRAGGERGTLPMRVAVHVSSDRPTSALDPVLRQAGGVLVMHDGHAVVANYGSAAGELAACVSAVGLADRSDLAKLVLDGPARAAAAPVAPPHRQRAGARAAPCSAAAPGGVPSSPERMLVICDAGRGDRLHAVLSARVARRSAREPHRSQRRARGAGRRGTPGLGTAGRAGRLRRHPATPRDVPPLTAHTGDRCRGPVAAGVRPQGAGADGRRGRSRRVAHDRARRPALRDLRRGPGGGGSLRADPPHRQSL